MVSVLHKELENEEEKLKYKKFRSCSQGSESISKFYICDWLIQSIFC